MYQTVHLSFVFKDEDLTDESVVDLVNAMYLHVLLGTNPVAIVQQVLQSSTLKETNEYCEQCE